MITKSCDLIGRSPSRYFTILPSLVAIGFLVVEICLVYHVISKDHVIKGPLDFMGESLSL